MRFATLLLLVSVMLGSAACAKKSTDPSQSPAPPVLQIVKIDPDSQSRVGIVIEPAGADTAAMRVELPGTLEYVADQFAEVGYVAEGRITAVHANVGDTVKRGQPLLTMLIPEITGAQAQALSAQATLDVARDRAKREAALLRDQLTSRADEEVARGRATVAEADLAAAKAKLALLGAQVPESSQGIRGHGQVTLTAPIAGVVVSRDAVLGAFVEPRDTVFSIADTRTLWAVLEVFESDLSSVHEGATVELSVDAIPGKTITGKVAMLEHEVSATSRALRARVVVSNADGALRRGLFVRAHVPIADVGAPSLLVPQSAVQPLGEREVVFVERDRGVFEVRTVVTRPRTSQVLRVESGLSPGEKIAVRGAFLLRGEVTKQ
jgi:cobalt-zinc-cadmium efflux system membrane fusion protein